MKHFQELIEEELRLVESDELVLANRKKKGVDPDEVLVNFVGKQGLDPRAPQRGPSGGAPGAEGAGSRGANSNPNATPNRPCFEFQKKGTCSRGNECKCAHVPLTEQLDKTE